MGKWHAYQVRVNPHLHSEAKKHLGKDDKSNSSHWYRATPAAGDLLMDDFSQEFHRFTKLKHEGELKFRMRPHAPFDELVEIEVPIECASTTWEKSANSAKSASERKLRVTSSPFA